MNTIWKLNSVTTLAVFVMMSVVLIGGDSFKTALLFAALTLFASALFLLFMDVAFSIRKEIRITLVAYLELVSAMTLSIMIVVINYIEKSHYLDIISIILGALITTILLYYFIGILHSEKKDRKVNIVCALPIGIGMIIGGVVLFLTRKKSK